jgi:hypothetical protein
MNRFAVPTSTWLGFWHSRILLPNRVRGVLSCWSPASSPDFREQLMSSPIAFREFSEDDYRKFIQTLSDEELIKAGKRLRSLCGDVVLTTPSAPSFIRGKSVVSHPRKFASRFSKRARILSAAIFLSTGYHQSVVLQPDENCQHIPRLDNNGVSKCESVRREVLLSKRRRNRKPLFLGNWKCLRSW